MQLLDAFGLAPSCAYSSTDPFVPIGRNVIPYDLNWIKESRVTTERVEMLHKWGVSSLVHFSIASHSLDPSAQHHPRDTEPDRQNRTNADYFKSKKSLPSLESDIWTFSRSSTSTPRSRKRVPFAVVSRLATRLFHVVQTSCDTSVYIRD